MKLFKILNWLSIILISCLCTIQMAAQENSTNTYKIQVGAFKQPDLTKMENLLDVGKLYVEDAGNGVNRIVLGYFSSKEEAEKLLSTVHDKGYPDAFVATHKQSAANKEETVITLDTFSERAATPPKPQEYVVEVGKYNTLSEIPKLWYIDQIGDVYVKSSDQAHTIYLGPYNDKVKASSVQQNLAKEGFTKANLQAVTVNVPKEEPTAEPVAETKIESTTFSEPTKNIFTVEEQKSRASAPIRRDIVKPNERLQQELVDFGYFTSFFDRSAYDMIHIKPYDPTQASNLVDASPQKLSEAKNESMKGQIIPNNLIYLFEGMPSNNPNLSYYALYNFKITNSYEAYIIRTGTQNYEEKNNTFLYVYDKNKMKFIARELISTVDNSGASYSTTQCWIMDMNQDTIPDLLFYTIEQNRLANGTFSSKDNTNAKVWMTNAFKNAQILNEGDFLQALGVQ